MGKHFGMGHSLLGLVGGFSSPGLECYSAAQGWNAFGYLEKANMNEWTEG